MADMNFLSLPLGVYIFRGIERDIATVQMVVHRSEALSDEPCGMRIWKLVLAPSIKDLGMRSPQKKARPLVPAHPP